MSEKNAVSS